MRCWTLAEVQAAADIEGALWLLSHIVRATPDDNARLDKLERRFVRAAQGVWKAHWPEQRDRILAVGDLIAPSVQEMRRALYDVGASFAGWLPDDAAEAIVRTAARGFDLGKTRAIEDAVAAGAAPPDTARGMWRVQRELTEDDYVALWETELSAAFEVVDERAARALSEQSLFWVRDVWSEGLGRDIADAAMSVFTQSDSRKTIAERLKAKLTQFDEPTDYWRLVASSAVVRSRSLGAVSGMRKARTETLRFVAVGGSAGDGKTSELCKSMHGTVFTMSHVESWESKVLGAKTPDELKAASPWVSARAVEGKTPDQLAASGVVAPPLHGHCRSKLVAETFESFASIGARIDAGEFDDVPTEFDDL